LLTFGFWLIGWGYHPGSGLLTNKADAAGQSVGYSYSAGGKLASRVSCPPKL